MQYPRLACRRHRLSDRATCSVLRPEFGAKQPHATTKLLMQRWSPLSKRSLIGGADSQLTRSPRSNALIRKTRLNPQNSSLTLRLWHRGGAATGDVAFWAPHADLFDSPRSVRGLVISALLERKDFVPAMALLVHWLSNADRVGLRQGGSSLPRLAERWLLHLRGSCDEELFSFGDSSVDQTPVHDTSSIWPLASKFFDYLEANAEEFWSAPQFNLGKPGRFHKRLGTGTHRR